MELMKSKGKGISVLEVPLETKQNVFSHVNRVFGQKFPRNDINDFEYLKLI